MKTVITEVIPKLNISHCLIILQKEASSLYIASKHGFTKVVKVLLEYGAQVNAIWNEVSAAIII
jgi:ABC-type cobalamin transport system ATPase subunit